MSQPNASTTYAALKKESTPGVAVTPTVYVPFYEQSLATDLHVIKDDPVIANKYKVFQNLQGLRSHGGEIMVMAEPNTACYWADMTVSRTATAGSNPYTHTYKPSLTADPNSYTLDLSYGNFVIRYFGVQASKMGIMPNEDERMKFNMSLSALGSFAGAEVLSVSTNTVNLTTTRDPSPTTGLVASDLVSLVDPTGVVPTVNTTITSITDGDTVVLGASAAAFSAGAMLMLRAASPDYTLLDPFLWGRTQFFFADTAAAALTASGTSSNQVRLDDGTEVIINYEFAEPEGEKRSGGFDPAALLRTVYELEFKKKQFLDTPGEIKYWNSMTKRACIMRCYSGTDKELRVTMNSLVAATNDMPTEKEAPIYHEVEYSPQYNQTDAQAFDLKVINAVATV